MRPEFSHRFIDRTNAAQDRQIAARLSRDGRLLTLARQNLRRWMARDGRQVRPVFQEWQAILTRLTRAEIADFLRSDTPRARRLRQSSPFMGLFHQAARQRPRPRHAKTRT